VPFRARIAPQESRPAGLLAIAGLRWWRRQSPWQQAHNWFIRGDDRLAENFPLVIQHLLKPDDYRKRALLDLTALRQDLGDGYRATADLVCAG
jgi:hypothetical protein